MSAISRLAVLGLTSIGAIVAIAGVSTSASADEIRDRCEGEVTIAEDFRADRSDPGNTVINLGNNEDTRVRLSPTGRLAWFCTENGVVTENAEKCMDRGGVVDVDVRLRDDGRLRITCG